MGCDIHATVERKDKHTGTWVMVHDLQWSNAAFTHRNYLLFAALAGVRGDGPEPRGLPPDVSIGTMFYVDKWGVDAHSHSWESLKMAMAKLCAVSDDIEHDDYYKAFGFGPEIAPEERNDYRIVFWFDN